MGVERGEAWHEVRYRLEISDKEVEIEGLKGVSRGLEGEVEVKGQI